MPSPYEVQLQDRAGGKAVALTHGEDSELVVAPTFGANIQSLIIKNEALLEPVSWDRFCESPTSYGACPLIPFANRIGNKTFNFEGVEYKLRTERNGLVRGLPWTFVSMGASKNGAWVKSRITSDFFPSQIGAEYPFPFVATLTHRLQEMGVEITMTMENTGSGNLGCSLGIHPYCRVDPVEPDDVVDAWPTVCVPANKHFQLDDAKLPTGEPAPSDERIDLRTPRPIGELELDDLFSDLTADDDGRVRCRIQNRLSQTVLEFLAEDFPYLMLYKPEGRAAIAIEPYTSAINAFNMPDGDLLVLRPREKFRGVVRIYRDASDRAST